MSQGVDRVRWTVYDLEILPEETRYKIIER